jgi:hypothetical protein
MAHRFRTIAKRSTTAAGYGYHHQQERARRLRVTQPTDPCGHCGKPLGDNRRLWALPHNETRTGYLPGFWHKRCNDIDGARRGNARQRAKRAPRAQSRAW